MKRIVHVRPDSITVRDRHRRDLGDLDSLKASIADVGVLQPILCRTVNERLHLVAGQRRLEACRQLGMGTVPILNADNLDTAAKALLAERDENECRKPMTPMELKSLTDELLEIEREAAKERQREHGGTAPGRPAQNTSAPRDGSEPSRKEAKVAATKAAGWSRAQYERVERVERSANDDSLPESVRTVAADALKQMETGDMTARKAATVVQEARVDAGVGSTAEREAVAKRRNPERPSGTETKIAEYERMAEEGYTSRQIAQSLGFASVSSLGNFRQRNGLPLPPADSVVGKPRNHDPNRIVSEMVYGLEAFAMSIDLVNVADIDADQADQWATSLKESLRKINRFLKEITQ